MEEEKGKEEKKCIIWAIKYCNIIFFDNFFFSANLFMNMNEFSSKKETEDFVNTKNTK